MNKQVKNIALAAVLTTGLFGTSAFAAEDEKPSIENNRLKNRVEYKSMQKTMSAIDEDQQKIVLYKLEKKANRKADKTIELHISKKELRKARADLHRDKAHLRIDKRDLKSDQKTALKEERKEIKATKKHLRQAKRELRQNRRDQDLYAFTETSNHVQDLSAQVVAEKQEVKDLEEDVDEFFDYLDDEIDQTLDK